MATCVCMWVCMTQEVTRINPQMEMQRETIRSGVFQPGHRLPTMSLAEYADREVADATKRQKQAQYVVGWKLERGCAMQCIHFVMCLVSLD